MGTYNLKLSNSAYAITKDAVKVEINKDNEAIVKEALNETIKGLKNNTETLADGLGFNRKKFWDYMVKYDTDGTKGLSSEEITTGLMALDSADGELDGELEASKLVAVEKPVAKEGTPTEAGDAGDVTAKDAKAKDVKPVTDKETAVTDKATTTVKLKGNVDKDTNVLTVADGDKYPVIAAHILADHKNRKALEAKKDAYNKANGTTLDVEAYTAKAVRQVAVKAYPGTTQANFLDPKKKIDLDDVLTVEFTKADDDKQVAKEGVRSRGKKHVSKPKAKVETPVTPATPATPAADDATDEDVSEETVAAKPTLLDTLRGRTGKLLAFLLGGAAVVLGVQQYRASRMEMPPQGPVYNNVPPNQGMFGRTPFNGSFNGSFNA